MPFPEILKAMRKKQGWSQMDLAVRAGVHLNTVNRWEAGGMPGGGDIIKLCDALGCTPNDLLGAKAPKGAK